MLLYKILRYSYKTHYFFSILPVAFSVRLALAISYGFVTATFCINSTIWLIEIYI